MKASILRMIYLLILSALLIPSISFASLAAKHWPASDEARQFVKDTIVIGMLAAPYGTGWTKNEQLLTYFQEARDAGITGHEMTLTAASMNWDALMQQHSAYRAAMAEEPEKYIFVRTTRDIEAAHIKGKTAVIWNSQTATILEEDLTRMAAVKEMGIASIPFDEFESFSSVMINPPGTSSFSCNSGVGRSIPRRRFTRSLGA